MKMLAAVLPVLLFAAPEDYVVRTWKKIKVTDKFYAEGANVGDFNKDGWTDIIIYGFPGEDVSWYENPQGKDGPWKRSRVVEKFDNESPQFVDVNGDGVPDVLAGAMVNCNRGRKAGMVQVLSGKDGVALATFDGGAEGDGLGAWISGLGDVDGDGLADFLVSANGADPGGLLDAGSLFLIPGKSCAGTRGH